MLCMSGKRFTVDTNVLVYAMDRRAGERHQMAREIVERAALADCCLTLQAVSEFFVVVSRKNVMPTADASAQARDWLDIFPVVPATSGAVGAALAAATSGRASYWDALLIASAAEAGCRTILTEDLADGSVFHGVRIMNPFGSGTLAAAAGTLLNGE
jgi:predicted nucleic acid-binding protein